MYNNDSLRLRPTWSKLNKRFQHLDAVSFWNSFIRNHFQATIRYYPKHRIANHYRAIWLFNSVTHAQFLLSSGNVIVPGCVVNNQVIHNHLYSLLLSACFQLIWTLLFSELQHQSPQLESVFTERELENSYNSDCFILNNLYLSYIWRNNVKRGKKK